MAILPTTQLEAGGSYVPPEQRRQKKLIVLFLIVILVTMGVVYYGFFYSGREVAETIQQGMEGLNLQNIVGSQSEEFSFVSKVSLEDDFDLFEDQKFTELKEYVPALDISGERGRTNPFARY